MAGSDILVSNGFEELELLDPKWALDRAGAAMFVIAPTKTSVTGWNQGREEKQVPVDISLESAKAGDFHALLLPGGRTSALQLAKNENAVEFVRDFIRAGKLVAAIGEGIRILLQAGVLRGRSFTHGVIPEAEVNNAGANIIKDKLLRDRNLITACRLDDVSALTHEMDSVLGELRQHSTNMRKTA